MQVRTTILTALLLSGTIVMPAFADTTGCATALKTEAEGGAGGNWQSAAGASAQKTEAEGGAGSNWQSAPGAAAQKTAASGSQQTASASCK
jgi:hypothetical protein